MCIIIPQEADLLYVQYASTKRTQRTIKHFGTKLWNSVCNAIDIDCASRCHDPFSSLFYYPMATIKIKRSFQDRVRLLLIHPVKLQTHGLISNLQGN